MGCGLRLWRKKPATAPAPLNTTAAVASAAAVAAVPFHSRGFGREDTLVDEKPRLAQVPPSHAYHGNSALPAGIAQRQPSDYTFKAKDEDAYGGSSHDYAFKPPQRMDTFSTIDSPISPGVWDMKRSHTFATVDTPITPVSPVWNSKAKDEGFDDFEEAERRRKMEAARRKAEADEQERLNDFQLL